MIAPIKEKNIFFSLIGLKVMIFEWGAAQKKAQIN